MFENTNTLPQDLVERAKTADELQQESLHEGRYPKVAVDSLRSEVLRAVLGRDGGFHCGRLTGCGQVSTGGGGANVAFTGHSLIPGGWRQARCTIDTTPANTDLEWLAIAPGAEANGIIVEYVDNAGATAVDWNAGTRTVTVGLNITGAGDTAANVLIALAASATGAQYIVQARNAYGSTGAGTIDETATGTLAGGTGTTAEPAVLTTASVANSNLTFTAVDYGADAKSVTVAYVHSAGMTTLPTVAVTEGASTVAIVVTATIATHTATNILDALRASADAMKWVHVRLADGNNGTGTPAAMAATALASPHGTDGFFARIGGLNAFIETLTDDGGTFDCAAGVGTAGDTADFVLYLGGLQYRVTAAIVA